MRVFESRPVLLVGHECEMVSRSDAQRRVDEALRTFGIAPLAIDLERMHRKMRECIRTHEANGWGTTQAETREAQPR